MVTINKHAYLIIAHNQFELLEVLVAMLDDVRNDIYIHIDAKVKEFDFEKFRSIAKHSKIVFINRISVTWGDYSQIKCEMILLKAAVENEDENNPYSYFHLLSGVDLPIKTNNEIHNFFEKNNGREFVHFTNNEPLPEFENRIKYYHVFRKKRNTVYKILAQIALRIQKLIGINRIKDKNIVVQKGSNWFSITGEFAHYAVLRESQINSIFKYSYCSDEVFLQTVFVNSPFKNNLFMPNCNDNQLAAARLIDWNRGNPYVFKSDDFEEIISSPAMFARKFSLEDKEIIYKIKDYIEAL